MSIFSKLFSKGSKCDVPPMPAWETIVEMMYEQDLDGYTDELVQVIYSKDRSKRYVILKNEKGFFTYQLEVINQYDPQEWQYVDADKNPLPAIWEPIHGVGKSIYENKEQLLATINAELECY